MKIFEYKNSANEAGNEIVPCFIKNSDCGHFHNPADFSYIGIGLSDRVYVPDSVTELTRASLKTRCYTAGVMMKLVNEVPTQMTNAEIDVVINSFCDGRNIA